MKNKSKLVLAPVALGTAASAFGALFFYRNFGKAKRSYTLKPETQKLVDEVHSRVTEELWGFTSFDGLRLKAHFYPAAPGEHRYALLVHGYQEIGLRMMPYAVHFMKQGFNVLMPDLRGHGLSDGDYVGYGYHDHYDIQGFIDMIRDRDPEAEIFLMGVSMGAATVMLTAGEFLPANVKCVIEDCGYTSAWEVCKHNLQKLYHLPTFPILTVTNWLMKSRHHYSLKEASPLNAVSKTTLPMLFIHGDHDDFVPFAMEQPLYEACSSEKELLIIPEAVHANSYKINPDLYWKTIDAFLSKYI